MVLDEGAAERRDRPKQRPQVRNVGEAALVGVQDHLHGNAAQAAPVLAGQELGERLRVCRGWRERMLSEVDGELNELQQHLHDVVLSNEALEAPRTQPLAHRRSVLLAAHRECRRQGRPGRRVRPQGGVAALRIVDELDEMVDDHQRRVHGLGGEGRQRGQQADGEQRANGSRPIVGGLAFQARLRVVVVVDVQQSSSREVHGPFVRQVPQVAQALAAPRRLGFALRLIQLHAEQQRADRLAQVEGRAGQMLQPNDLRRRHLHAGEVVGGVADPLRLQLHGRALLVAGDGGRLGLSAVLQAALREHRAAALVRADPHSGQAVAQHEDRHGLSDGAAWAGRIPGQNVRGGLQQARIQRFRHVVYRQGAGGSAGMHGLGLRRVGFAILGLRAGAHDDLEERGVPGPAGGVEHVEVAQEAYMAVPDGEEAAGHHVAEADARHASTHLLQRQLALRHRLGLHLPKGEAAGVDSIPPARVIAVGAKVDVAVGGLFLLRRGRTLAGLLPPQAGVLVVGHEAAVALRLTVHVRAGAQVADADEVSHEEAEGQPLDAAAVALEADEAELGRLEGGVDLLVAVQMQVALPPAAEEVQLVVLLHFREVALGQRNLDLEPAVQPYLLHLRVGLFVGGGRRSPRGSTSRVAAVHGGHAGASSRQPCWAPLGGQPILIHLVKGRVLHLSPVALGLCVVAWQTTQGNLTHTDSA
eukprot:scaffold10_cov257-Pinguiococcus_pyrenoidosus.AAC.54